MLRETQIPPFIEAVIVQREITYGKRRFQFLCHHYPIPRTALRPGSFSPRIPMLSQLLGVRILYTCIPLPSGTTRDLFSEASRVAPFFFGYWPSADTTSYTNALGARTLVFYRDDYKPLYPKQIEALWKFCDWLFCVIVPPSVFDYSFPEELESIVREMVRHHVYPHPDKGQEQRFEKLVRSVGAVWDTYCTADNFGSFFDHYRYKKLLEGDEGWRNIKSFWDV